MASQERKEEKRDIHVSLDWFEQQSEKKDGSIKMQKEDPLFLKIRKFLSQKARESCSVNSSSRPRASKKARTNTLRKFGNFVKGYNLEFQNNLWKGNS